MSYSRNTVITTAKAWINEKAEDVQEKIINLYNEHTPLARNYQLKETDSLSIAFVSAVFIECGYADIIPIECDGEGMIKSFQENEAWKAKSLYPEYIPFVGDILFYKDSFKTTEKQTIYGAGIVKRIKGDNIDIIEINDRGVVKYTTLALSDTNDVEIFGYAAPSYHAKTTYSIVEEEPQETDNLNIIEEQQEQEIAEEKESQEIEFNTIKELKIIKKEEPIQAKEESKNFNYDEKLKGIFKTSTKINIRKSAGNRKPILITVPKGTEVECTGYFSTIANIKWVNVSLQYKDKEYKGFCSKTYLV